MSQIALESFGAYQKARQLFDLVVTDMEALKANPPCYRLVSRQIGSADSILCKHRIGVRQGEPNRVCPHGALPVKRVGAMNGSRTGSVRT